jgi:hypothetical protein
VKGRGLDVVPSVSMSERKRYDAESGTTTDWQPSLDVFYEITPSLNAAVGVIVTDGDPHSNQDSTLVGTDFRYRNTRLPGWRLLEGEGWYQQVDAEGVLDEDRAFGLGISSPNNTGWRGALRAKQIEANFDPAVGFVNETGVRDFGTDFGYRHRYRDNWMRSVYGGVQASRVERIDTGGLDRDDVRLQFDIESATQDRMVVNVSPIADCDRGLRSTSSDRSQTEHGSTTAARANVNADVEWRPSEHLLTVAYSRNDIDLPEAARRPAVDVASRARVLVHALVGQLDSVRQRL